MKNLILLFTLCLSLNAWAVTLPVNVRVIAVHDGDSLTIVNENKINEKIRVFRIDAPEIKYSNVPTQPYALSSKASLSTICMNKPAIITRKSISYGRTVALVNCAGIDVATYQIHNGSAWVYRYTATKALKAMQLTASTHKFGLWALPNPIEPYSWRRGVR